MFIISCASYLGRRFSQALLTLFIYHYARQVKDYVLDEQKQDYVKQNWKPKEKFQPTKYHKITKASRVSNTVYTRARLYRALKGKCNSYDAR